MCVGVSVKVCGCVCASVDACTGVWVCLHMCIVWGDLNHIIYTIIIMLCAADVVCNVRGRTHTVTYVHPILLITEDLENNG